MLKSNMYAPKGCVRVTHNIRCKMSSFTDTLPQKLGKKGVRNVMSVTFPGIGFSAKIDLLH